VYCGGTATAGGSAVHGPREGHTTLGVFAHLFNTDHFADAMVALGAMEAGPLHAENVVPLWG